MRLAFEAPCATEDERARGVAAAELFLQRAGISIEAAMHGVEVRAAWNACGLLTSLEPDPFDLAAAEAWDNAFEAARMACYRDRSTPWGASLRALDAP